MNKLSFLTSLRMSEVTHGDKMTCLCQGGLELLTITGKATLHRKKGMMLKVFSNPHRSRINSGLMPSSSVSLRARKNPTAVMAIVPE